MGIYPDSHLEQVEYIINHSDSTFVVTGDQEQADKILDIKEKCPKLKKVIVDDPKGMRHYDDPLLIFFKDVQKMGRELAEKEPQLFEEMMAKVSADDVGMINYTSGTTGLPKGSMITHKNMVSVAKAQNHRLEAADITGCTFTITNLGVYQIDEFCAIINPPQAGILAVGQMKKTLFIDENDAMHIKKACTVTGSFDHRIINGAKGAVFLEKFKKIIEEGVE